MFQQYDFEFVNERIVNVVENIKPDMIIFMGNVEDNTATSFEHKESVNYISGLTNVVAAAKYSGVKKFVYISSIDVCEGNIDEPVEENSFVKPVTSRMKTYLQGEQLCGFYREEGVFDVSIIRIPTVFGTFGEYYVKGNIVEKIISLGLKTREVTINPNKYHNLIDLNDAIEACYDIAFRIDGIQDLPFHVPGIKYNEKQIADIVNNEMNKKLEIQEKPVEISCRVDYAKGRLEKQGFVLRRNLEDEIGVILNTIKENEIQEIKKKRRNANASKFIFALLENIVLFAIAYLLTMITANNWIGEVVDFYLLYVILIAVVHGTAQTLVAAILSIIGQFSSMLSEEGIGGILGNYGPYVWVLQLLIAGMLVAYMRDKFKINLKDTQEDNKYLKIELDEIKEINDSNVYIKEIYEKRLINYKNSMSRLYEVTSALDYLEPQKVIFQATDVISRLMESTDVAVYIGNGTSKYYRLAAATSEAAKSLGKSYALEEGTNILDSLINKEIFRNKNLAERLPVMAGATYNENKITAIIMVWTDALEATNIYQSNLLAILCRLIEKSILRAYDFLEALQDESYYTDTNVMKEEAFIKRLSIYEEGKDRGLLDYSILDLYLSDNRKKELEIAGNIIRDTDYIGIVGNSAKILLTNTNTEEVQFVVKRFYEKGLKVSLEMEASLEEYKLPSDEDKDVDLIDVVEAPEVKKFESRFPKSRNQNKNAKKILENFLLRKYMKP